MLSEALSQVVGSERYIQFIPSANLKPKETKEIANNDFNLGSWSHAKTIEQKKDKSSL